MSDHIEDYSRYVITGEFAGNALPGKIQQLDRTTYVEANAHIKGSILGGDIIFMGSPFHVEQSILSRRDIKVQSLEGRGVLGSGVLAKGSIIVEKEADFEQGLLAIYGDVHAESVNLTNTVVLGNIFTKKARLRNSFIMGFVHAERRLAINDTVIGTYNAGSIEFGQNVKLIYPYALSCDKPKFDHADIKCMTFMNLQDYIFSEKEDIKMDDVFSLSEDDLLKAPAKKTLIESGKEKTKDISVYTIGPGERILDAKRCNDSIRSNSKLLQYLVLRNSIDIREHPEHESFMKNLPKVEKRMLQLASVNI